ncbi:MAG: glycoside hydrolase family 30 beta sandwich domain-containing protein, partial [Gemmatimonadaceae bacterium]
SFLDFMIEQLVIPLRQRLRARGDDLWFHIGYVGANTGLLHRDNPEEYAELALAAFQHMQQKFGFVPRSLELVNEPNLGNWNSQQVGQNLVAVKRRLNQAGFAPQFVGPTASSAYGTILMFDQMIQIPGVAQALNEISYHRYGGTLMSYLQDIAQRGAQFGMRTSMLEHIGSGYEALHDDLTIANVSTWKQFSLAFCLNGDDGVGGGLYFIIHGAEAGENNPQIITAKTSTYLRQYFRYVYLGAVRLGATTANAAFSPVAFRNPDGKFTVVVKATSGGSFTVGGLPAGSYGIEYTTAQEYARSLSDVAITSSQAVSAAIPAAGALTIYAK